MTRVGIRRVKDRRRMKETARGELPETPSRGPRNSRQCQITLAGNRDGSPREGTKVGSAEIVRWTECVGWKLWEEVVFGRKQAS